MSLQQLAVTAAALRPGGMREGTGPVMPATKIALQIPGQRLVLDEGKVEGQRVWAAS